MTSSPAATPPASGTPMDLIGKTVRWESGNSWFTAVVLEWIPETAVWRSTLVDPGSCEHYEHGSTVYFAYRRFLTVIDSERDTEDRSASRQRATPPQPHLPPRG